MTRVTHRDERERNEVAPGVNAGLVGHGERLHSMEVTIDPSGEVSTHEHPHEQISYVVEGEVIMTVEGEDHRLDAGSAVHVPGGTQHAARNESDATAMMVDIFSPPREEMLD